jgi:hypothetical protein
LKSLWEVQAERDEEEYEDDVAHIPCSRCGLPTTWDATYGDLCFRCIRANNE